VAKTKAAKVPVERVKRHMATKMEAPVAPGDPLALLRYEHRAIDGLFTQFATRKDQPLARRICSEVLLHSKLEEDTVYQEAAEIADVHDKSGKGLAEHGHMAELVESISGLAAGDELNDLMQELREAVEQHVRDEELSIFPALRSLPKARLDDLALRLTSTKADLIKESRPRPAA
jgi:hemerythrin superfamily protein